MKKMITTLCILLACLTALWSAGAEELPEPVRPALAPGESITFSLRLTAQAAGMQARIQWDPTQLDLADEAPAYSAEFKKGAMIAMINPEPENGTIALVYLRQDDLYAQDMEVMNLSFLVRDDALSGAAEIAVDQLQLVNAHGEAVDASAEGTSIDIIGGAKAPEAPPAPESTPEAFPDTITPGPAPLSRLYLQQLLPEATIEPTAYPTPEAAASPAPTASPKPTPTRPGGHIVGGSGAADATAAPTASPTPAAPAEDKSGNEPIRLSARAVDGGVIVELIAENTLIGGLQAEIECDSTDVQLVKASFSEAFLNGAMIHMINDSQPGRISLVYSNLNGYTADGSAVFTAQFRSDDAQSALFSLRNAKYIGIDANMTAVPVPDQQVQCEIQPMDDLTVVEEDGIRIAEVPEDEPFSLTIDPDEVISLRLKGREIPSAVWSVSREEIASITPEGLLTAHSSGLITVSATDAQSGALIAEGRICVRNAQLGLPIEITNLSFGDGVGDLFALSTAADEAAFAARGIVLTFRDEARTVRIEGLLPEEMTAIPASAFGLCSNLVSVEILAQNIIAIEAGAFAGCDLLESVALYSAVCELQPDALPAGSRCILRAPASSAAAACASEHGFALEILDEAGDVQ